MEEFVHEEFFRSFYNFFAFFAFQPFTLRFERNFTVSKALFTLWSSILITATFIASVFCYLIRNDIFYVEDSLGNFTDKCKFVLFFMAIILYLAESLWNHNGFCRFFENLNQLEEILRKHFKFVVDIRSHYKKLRKEILVLYGFTAMVLFLTELMHAALTDNIRSTSIMVVFWGPYAITFVRQAQIILYVKISIMYMEIIQTQFDQVVEFSKFDALDVHRYLEKKCKRLEEIHDIVRDMVFEINRCTGLSELIYMIKFKYLVLLDFYWLVFRILNSDGFYEEVCKSIFSLCTVFESFMEELHKKSSLYTPSQT